MDVGEWRERDAQNVVEELDEVAANAYYVNFEILFKPTSTIATTKREGDG